MVSWTGLPVGRNAVTLSLMTELTNEQIHDTLVLPYLNHAARMFEAGYATDEASRLVSRGRDLVARRPSHGMLRA
jgi:hypothetical protein